MTADTTTQHIIKTKNLIDELKAVCAGHGLGNSGKEFDVIIQIFLYKYLNDKFTYEVKKAHPEWGTGKKLEEKLNSLSDDDYKKLEFDFDNVNAILKPYQLLPRVFDIQNEPDFAKSFDDILIDIGAENNTLFAVTTPSGTKIQLFHRISNNVDDQKDAFVRALINKLVQYNFEDIMEEGFDFFSTIFEYLIHDYNNDSGGKYAEYYTPHAVAKIMAAILVPEPVKNKTIFDPSAGSGTLLMNLAHAIGADNCTVYSQDISQKSSDLLRLNLILNNLVHSIPNVIKGNTITDPYHRDHKFDYIVSNPPFKLDFSDDVDTLAKKENNERFFAGIPNVPKKAKSKMAIYSMFLQHIMHSLNDTGKAAVVVPTGFITAQSGIDKKIREQMIARKMLAGVVSMPSNIFATTGTNVSIVFLDKTNDGKVVLIDAGGLGTTVKEGKNQKTVLQPNEEQKIIDTFVNKNALDDFSVVVTYEEIKTKNYSLSAGQYFEIKIEYDIITKEDFIKKVAYYENYLKNNFEKGNSLNKEILKQIKDLRFEEI
ncbi:MAG: SAM-dependent methyltransferase [Aequorivita sp.]|nr:SAM-dependent methyltransferase [Aequorivita sp.]MBF32388.1 SAM-dependent methyltransferase [Aequorivita sp.]|tara:strand:- start:11825 stop:13444 length:1620 start_codon:yes stop_codon:yes gene_type:complete